MHGKESNSFCDDVSVQNNIKKVVKNTLRIIKKSNLFYSGIHTCILA